VGIDAPPDDLGQFGGRLRLLGLDVEFEFVGADLEGVALGEWHPARDAVAVDECPVARAGVLDIEPALLADDAGVVAADKDRIWQKRFTELSVAFDRDHVRTLGQRRGGCPMMKDTHVGKLAFERLRGIGATDLGVGTFASLAANQHDLFS